nr:alpha/beta hydrolase [Rhodoferax sp.]
MISQSHHGRTPPKRKRHAPRHHSQQDRALSQRLGRWRARHPGTVIQQTGAEDATLECATSFATTDFRADLAAFGVPTLIIHGTADKAVPIAALVRAEHAAIAQSTLIEYQGSPHGLFATDKRRLSEDLLAFVRR